MEQGEGEENLGDSGSVELKVFVEIRDDGHIGGLCVTSTC